MDVPALSMSAAQGSLAQAVQIRVLSMAKDQSTQQAQQMVQMMQQSVQPNLGGNLDIRV
ncbi:YjfB family protein [Paenibacillus chondroitinus]|uniref:YjfB family protein n=1 Tax=Paenibacillus chondroitinus TaxID=59842 RepID=A0ABU6DMN2_9BACL|nr:MULTISPECIES: YjfB family protein [Paenibacillus]MCY9661355.1 YjfB family protein [Paenibacillus anseongense]MEB4798096.1 YjfB family protein [Paenibacillus chondroitinus]